MSNEEEQEGRERMRLAERANALRAAVMPLLLQLAPQAADSDLDSACSEVVSAIMSYEQSSKVRKEEPLEKKLKDLRRMKKAFQKCLELLEPDAGHYGALRLAQFAQLNQKGKNGRISELKRQLASATDAVDASLEYLQAQPRHGADENQAKLAAELRWPTTYFPRISKGRRHAAFLVLTTLTGTALGGEQADGRVLRTSHLGWSESDLSY